MVSKETTCILVGFIVKLACIDAFLQSRNIAVSSAVFLGPPATFLFNNKSNQEPDNPLAKASWYTVEAFGKVFGKPNEDLSSQQDNAPTCLDETLERLKQDNDKAYFLSGKVDTLIYDKQCTFADPFVSFQGRDRFVENLANLGSFVSNYSVRGLEYNVSPSTHTVESKFMVKLELNLPWKPVLAWPWGVKCTINPGTNLIELHEESWDIPPIEGVKQIFRKPTVKIP